MRRAVVATLLTLLASALSAVPSGAAAGDLRVVASGLDAPGGVAVGSDGSVYVTAGDSLQRVAPGGGSATVVASGLATPRGVAALGGDVYVAEAGADRVVRVLPDGTLAAAGISGLDAPTGLATDGTRLFVANTNRGSVVAWTPGDAASAAVADALAFPTAVASAPDGSVLVADTFNRVVRRIAANGASSVVAGGGVTASTCHGDGGSATAASLSPPASVAVDAAGNVYVGDAGNGRVVRVSPDGRLTTIATVRFPSSLAVDGGDLLVADSAAGSVLRIEAAATAFTTQVDRVAGADRYATAAELSARLFAPGVPAVFVATGESFPDALAASGAAGAAGGPVLLTRRDALPGSTAAELQRLRPARVVVLGGTTAVTDAVALDAARAAGVASFERRAGSDRYETAAALSSASFGEASTAVVVTGESFADSLPGGAAASLAGGPVLLTRPDALPDAAAAELRRLRPASVLIVGGPFAVSAGVEQAVRDATGAQVQRLAGDDRYATSAAVAGTVASATTVLVASGGNFPDGLAAAAAATRAGGPVLLVPCFDVPSSVAAARGRLAAATVLVVGGAVAVPDRPAALVSAATP